jgi:hypothetical protein
MTGQIDKIDSGASRFRVTKRDDALVLEGAITDATKFDMLKELGAKGVDVDLSGIVCTGLTGARALWEALTQYAPECRLVNVPYSIFIVLMNTDALPFIKHQRMRFAQIAVDGKSVVIVDEKDITGTPASVPGSAKIIKLHHALWDDKQNADERGWSGRWSMEHMDEGLFWADYIGFISNTVIQSQQVLASTVYAIDRYLRLIDLRVKSFEKAWMDAGLRPRTGSWGGLAAIETAMAGASGILQKMLMFVVTSQSDYGRIMQTLMTSEKHPYDVLKSFTIFRKRQETVSKAIEEAGVSLGALLFSVVTFRAIRGDVDAEFPKLPKESIAKILESLDIMNPMAEDDVKEAMKDVIAESENGESDVEACIVILQAFDLVRQILEHRTQEYEILEQSLPKLAQGDITWESLRDDIVKQIRKRMVTDQEKSAFECYLGYLEDPNAQKEETSTPGDVMLF